MSETSAEKPRVRRKTDDSYEPVVCKQCAQEIYQLVSLVIRCPLGWQNLSKEGLRNKAVAVQGAQWSDTQWFCGCESYGPRSKSDRGPRARPPENAPVDNRISKPGQRKSKGLVARKKKPSMSAGPTGSRKGLLTARELAQLEARERKRDRKLMKAEKKAQQKRGKNVLPPEPPLPPIDTEQLEKKGHARKISDRGMENLYAWHDAGIYNAEIARRLGVDRSAVRYHVNKRAKLREEAVVQQEGPA